MKLKLFWAAFFVAIAIAAGWNFNQTQNETELSDLTLDNLEAIAEGRGNFPACQKNEGSGDDWGHIPLCVNGSCKDNTWARKYKLDVNYCSQ